jgi:hemerythrin superfamily protein
MRCDASNLTAASATRVAPSLHIPWNMGLLRKLIHRDTTTDVLELLASQHKEVDELFAQLESGTGNRQVLFTELADKLAAHATVEEKIFYPMVMGEQTEDQLREAVEEHLSIKRVLADLVSMSPSDEAFDAKLFVLKEQVSHHAHKEEEGKLFPKVRAMFDHDQRAALGNEILVLFEELMLSHPYRRVPLETSAAARLPRRR